MDVIFHSKCVSCQNICIIWCNEQKSHFSGASRSSFLQSSILSRPRGRSWSPLDFVTNVLPQEIVSIRASLFLSFHLPQNSRIVRHTTITLNGTCFLFYWAEFCMWHSWPPVICLNVGLTMLKVSTNFQCSSILNGKRILIGLSALAKTTD